MWRSMFIILIALVAFSANAANKGPCVLSPDRKQLSVQLTSPEASQTSCTLDCSLEQADATHSAARCKLNVESSTKPACASVNFDGILSEAVRTKQFNCDESQQ